MSSESHLVPRLVVKITASIAVPISTIRRFCDACMEDHCSLYKITELHNNQAGTVTFTVERDDGLVEGERGISKKPTGGGKA